ncbi:MAG: AAA family ATPase, partial [Anaerolineae bacterium]|nr:AAA family ATPase [Anaerolineae bacterium]
FEHLNTLQQTIEHYQADFLDGFSLPDAPAFDEWQSLQRERWHQVMAQILDHLSQAQLDSRYLDQAVATATRWIQHDPLHEAAYRRLMETYALAGDIVAALKTYQSCQTTLQRELGIDPSPITHSLAERIKQSPPQTISLPAIESPALQPSVLPFAGRAGEHARLAELFQQTRAGQTQVVVVEGEAGIGKTRLVSEFLAGVALQGVDLLQGRAFETGGRLSFQPVVDALRQRLERENAPDDLLADVWLVELSRLLPELRERYPDLPPPTFDEASGRIRLSESVARLGQALASRRPVIFFLDDLQWADTTSLDLLHYACRVWARAELPLMLLLTMRIEAPSTTPEVGEWLATIGREMPLTRLSLGPLSAEETEALLSLWHRRLAGQEPGAPLPATTFARWLYKETAGQPFFINETLQALPDQDFTLNALPPEGILPPGVRQVILSRLSHLPTRAADLLTASAVVGRPCSFERLCQIIDVPELEGLEYLEVLLTRHLLAETGDVERPITFAHDKIRDVVYTEAGAARRRLYHRRAFEALEHGQAPPAELAHHALRAGLTEPAFHYSIAAGDAARQVFAIRDAIVHYEQARSLISNLQSPIPNLQSPISNLYTHLARAYEVEEEPDQAAQICREMLAQAQSAGWPTLECAALNRLASLAIYAQEMERATVLLTQAKSIAEASGDKASLAQTEWSLGQLTHHVNDFEASRLHSEHALALAREIGDQALIAGSAQTLAFAHLFQGELVAGMAAMTEARDGYVALGNRVLEADALVGLVMPYILTGKADRAIEVARQALEIGQEIENVFSQCMSRPWLVCGLVDRGDYQEAAALTTQNLAIARSQALAPKLLATFSAGLLYWAVGDHSAAQKVHLELMPHLEEADVAAYLEQNLANLCVDATLAGDWDAAHTYARQALSYRDYRTLPLLVKPHWPETEALLRGGDVELAREDVRRWGELVGEIPRFRVGYLRSLALLAKWDGDPQQAIVYLQEALTLAEEIGVQGEQWQILLKLGQLYQTKGDEEKASRTFEKAVKIIKALAAEIDDEGLRAGFLAAEWLARLKSPL